MTVAVHRKDDPPDKMSVYDPQTVSRVRATHDDRWQSVIVFSDGEEWVVGPRPTHVPHGSTNKQKVQKPTPPPNREVRQDQGADQYKDVQ